MKKLFILLIMGTFSHVCSQQPYSVSESRAMLLSRAHNAYQRISSQLPAAQKLSANDKNRFVRNSIAELLPLQEQVAIMPIRSRMENQRVESLLLNIQNLLQQLSRYKEIPASKPGMRRAGSRGRTPAQPGGCKRVVPIGGRDVCVR